MYTFHTRFCTFGADSYAQSVLINKISAAELSRKFIKTALLVGSLSLPVQVYRRLYECLCINNRSEAKMSLVHYLVGILHYWCVVTGFLAQLPGFAGTGGSKLAGLRASNLTATHVAGVSLFAWAFVNHHRWTMSNLTIKLDFGFKRIFFWSLNLYRVNRTFAEIKKKSQRGGYSLPEGTEDTVR